MSARDMTSSQSAKTHTERDPTMSSNIPDPMDMIRDPLPSTNARTTSPTPSLPDGALSEWANMSVPQRKQLELSFSIQMTFPINNSWSTTEQYVLSRDEEMLRYLAVYPVNKWLMGSELAKAAYQAMLDRDRLRNAGKSIWDAGRPYWWPLGPQPEPEPISVATSDAASPVGQPAPRKASTVTKRPKSLRAPNSKQVVSLKARKDSPLESQPDSASQKVESTRVTRTRRAATAKVVDTAQHTVEKPPLDSMALRKQTAKQTQTLKKIAGAVTADAPPYLNGIRKNSGDDDADFPWQVSWSHEQPTAWSDDIYSSAELKAVQTEQAHNIAKLAEFKDKRKQERRVSDGTATGDGDSADAQVGRRRKSAPRPLAGTSIRSVQVLNHTASKLAARLTLEPSDPPSDFADAAEAIDHALRNPFYRQDGRPPCQVRNEIGETTIPGLAAPLLTAQMVARTRLQLDHSRVLTDVAAERMIDFCPDMLTDYKLLQVLGETSMTNATVQRRLAMNGIIVCDSTITKRVSAALARPCENVHPNVSEETRAAMKALYRTEFTKYQEYHKKRRALSRDQLPSKFDRANGGDDMLKRASEQYIAQADVDTSESDLNPMPYDPDERDDDELDYAASRVDSTAPLNTADVARPKSIAETRGRITLKRKRSGD